MAGSGPDYINASVGAAFGILFGPFVDQVIEGLKFVYRCQEQCAALREELEKIQPLLKKISDQCQGDSAMKKWLDAFKKCVYDADEMSKKCKSDSSRIWDRAFEVKYGGEILKLREQISNNVMLASLALLALQSGSASESSVGSCETLQQVPGKILGMEDHFDRVKSSVIEGHRSESCSCIGIRGMGGSGKTLLAKMVNNDKDIRQVFGEESIIWITVGRDASVPAIYEQMRKRLKVCSDGGSLEDQCTQLSNEFSRRRVLLILDDVWDYIVHEYKELVEWLDIAKGPGSVTVLTTREESITSKCVSAGVEIILRLSGEHSWELFRTHAFGGDAVPLNKELEGLAKEVCEECKCLPLALKVIGLAMKGKRGIAEWRKTLCRLRDSTMVNKSVEKQLFERLQISYDQLDGPLKTCFLYFAAFPEDCEIPLEHLCQIWVAEALFGNNLDQKGAWDEASCAVNELLSRSLIEECSVDGDGEVQRVKMHDILRDLARQLTRQGAECECESLFRVERKDLEEFPSTWLGLPLKVNRLSLWGNKIKRFPNNFVAPGLKICILYPQPRGWRTADFYGGPEPLECIMEEGFISGLHDLKYLQLCANPSLQKLPESMGGLGSLQHLSLECCRALQQLPKSMGGLGSLQHFDLERCSQLQQLPKSMGGLGSLQYLNLRGCIVLQQLPQSMGGLGSLQHLNLKGCDALQQLPESMGGLGSLQHLNLSDCRALQQLPESIGGLGSLQHLDLFYCKALQQLPESMGGLGSLQHLNLSYCEALQQLPESMGGLGSLQHLNLSCCFTLQQLPESMGGLVSLQHLNLAVCEALQQLPESMGGLVSLQHLNLAVCEALQQLPESMGGFGSLQHLDLEGCSQLQQLPKSMGGLGSLQHLNLSYCWALQQLPENMGELGSLQHLDLSYCWALQQLPESMGELGSLQHLNLKDCRALQQLPVNMGGLRSLQHLDLEGCSQLQQLPKSMGGLGSLQHLNLSYCWALQQLPENMGELGSLQHLDLSYCWALQQLPESMGELGSLQHLNLKDCRALQQLPVNMGGLRSLQHLNLSYCDALQQLPESMGELGSLQHLDLKDCRLLIEFPKLWRVFELRILF